MLLYLDGISSSWWGWGGWLWVLLLKLSSVVGSEQSWTNPRVWGAWFGSLQSSTFVFIGVSSVNRSVVSDSLWPHGLEPTRLLCSWDSPSKNTGVGCHSLLQGISQPKDRTHISCSAGRFFTVWVTHMTQQLHAWIYVQRKWIHYLEEMPAFPCSLQHYSQLSRYEHNLNVCHLMTK